MLTSPFELSVIHYTSVTAVLKGQGTSLTYMCEVFSTFEL